MECKDNWGDFQSSRGNGFNRNIVECKGKGGMTYRISLPGFNRNIVECKVESVFSDLFTVLVLIETLWNVKTLVEVYPGCPRMVLIETLWNVKETVFSPVKTPNPRFNRNIVECKGVIR